MAHVWNIIDGDIYVSKNGDDVNGDGSMTNPYASLEKAFQEFLNNNEKQKWVIGTGAWREAISGWGDIYLYGDGDVLFDDQGEAQLSFNIYWRYIPYPVFDTVFNNITFSATAKPIIKVLSQNLVNFYNCTFINKGLVCAYNGQGDTQGINLYSCIIIEATEIKFLKSKNSIFYKSEITPEWIDTYFISINNIFYETKFIDNRGSHYFCDIFNCISPPIILENSMQLNPKFNNPEIGDYTLQPTSPCLFAGKNNSNIGAYGLGYSFNANSSEFTKEGGAIFSQTTEVDDIIRTQQTINGITRFLFQLNAGHTSGNVESAWIDLQTIRYLLITHIFDNLIYNSLGVATSRPDNLETAGEKAVYYDFELKYCNEESEKDTATFKSVIWNKSVTVDNSGNGNANSNFVASEAQYISARFIKIKFYMKEG